MPDEWTPLRLRRSVLIAIGLVFVLGYPAGATGLELEREIKNALNARKRDVYFLKSNAPYQSGTWGKRALVSVTPGEGVRIADSATLEANMLGAHARTLELRVNDAVKVDDWDWNAEESSVQVWIEGTGLAKGKSSVVKFVGLRSTADFEECWSEMFSSVSIEQKYDWPQDIKSAVAQRQVLKGMTPEQVVVAVGNPDRVSHELFEGREIEMWTIQMSRGAKVSYWGGKIDQPREIQVGFAGGRVVKLGGFEQPPPEIKLK